jgi:hypothetical protein
MASKDEIETMLAKQTNTLKEYVKASTDCLAGKIESLKEEFDAMRANVDNIRNDLDNTKKTMNEMEQTIERELEERIAKENQIFIRGAKTKESVEKAIEVATGGGITPKWIRAIKRKDANQNNDPIAYIAELQNKEEKTKILRSSRNLKESTECKDIYIKPNETRKQRENYQKLKAQIEDIKAAQTNSDEKYPVIRNNRIVFLEKRKNPTAQTGQAMQTIEVDKTGTNSRTRRNSKNRTNQEKATN